MDDCSIHDIVYDIIGCTSDSTFAVAFNFEYENIDAGGFDVYAGDHYLGFFDFEHVPVITEHFPTNETGNYVVLICESDNPDCCASLEFEGPICNDTLCNISNLTWEITPCDTDGHFFFILDFDFENVGNEGFHVVGNGNEYGNFSYENLPIELGPFETSNTVWEFLVVDAQFPACFEVIVPGDVDCIVGTEDIDQDEIFQVYNNGTVPGILPLKDIAFSLFNSNGKMLIHQKILTAGELYSIGSLPSGMYIGTVQFEGRNWPVKLIRNTR